MALRKTIDLLPEIFRTDRNEKFLNATLDQLTTPEFKQKMNGYIGRVFAPSYNTGDAYVQEQTNSRQNYQLEPGVVYKSKDEVGSENGSRIEFLSNYVDMVNRIGFYGGDISDHNRLYQNEYYNWSSFFDFDKFVNFSQYYWLPNGPDAVQVFNELVDTETDWTVARVDNEFAYHIENHNSVNNPRITLARGGSYTFTVDQIGNNFWIQTEPGTDGIKNIQSNISTREVLGVQNNGDDFGTITFNVPEADAQNRWITMPTTADVDFAMRQTFNEVDKQVFSAFIAANPEGFDGIIDAGVINGSTLVFYNDTPNEPEANWESGGLFDTPAGYDAETFDPTVYVPEDQRYDVYLIDIDSDNIIRLARITDIPQNEKVLITRGTEFGNLYLWKNALQKLELQPVITAPLTRLFYQDQTDETRFGLIDIVENGVVAILDVEDSILGQTEYIHSNGNNAVPGVEFTNGMKIEFNSDVTPSTYADKQFYVEGVGNGITLVPVDELIVPEPFANTAQEGFDTTSYDVGGFAGSSNAPLDRDYFTINKASQDRNAWSRSNRWTHIDVIELTAQYNDFNFVIDQNSRANRPIIEFDADLQLYNYGRVFKKVVTLFDSTQTDALSNVEGELGYFIDGVAIETGATVIWAGDEDEIVRGTIYEVTITDPQNDGTTQLHMTEVGTAELNDVILVSNGLTNQGIAYHYNGTDWIQSQQKTTLNQTPYFDIIDTDGNSFGDDSVYLGTAFTGSRLFSYQQQVTGTEDTVLGFPLSYKNFENVGDIIFENNYARDKFTYSPADVINTKNINDGFVNKIIDINTVQIRNDWTKVNTPSRQYQVIEYTVQDELQTFEVGVTPKVETGPVNLYVYNNSTLLLGNTTQNITNFVDTDYTTLAQDNNFYVILNVPAVVGDQITIKVYADNPGKYGYYEIPKNLENNAQNANFTTMTLGQIRNHVTEVSHNMSTFIGEAPGASNLRDLTAPKSFPGKMLQHSAGAHIAAFMNSGENINVKNNSVYVHNTNFMNSIDYSAKEYTKFKNKFHEAISTMDLDFTDVAGSVESVIAELKIGKTESFPFFYSDMIGYGSDNTTTTYTVRNPEIKTYDYGTVFDNTVVSNRSVLVYLNDVQVYNVYDYIYDPDGAIITFTNDVILSIGDTIKFVDYNNTDGSFIPPTPSKLGMYPKFKPEIYADNTFRTTVNVIQGHDGSIFVAYNDARDDLILELEKRIYNNIKSVYKTDVFDLNSIVPGKFRTTDYSKAEIDSVLSLGFMNWSILNKIDYATQVQYDVTDKFTWNYSNFTDVTDGELLPGYWRGVYRHFYDTDRPHTHPWEMLGVSEKPSWWDQRYGVAPYAKGNDVLWEDLRDGKLYTDASGITYSTLTKYQRPTLMDIIPVDANGNLTSPLVSVVKAYNTTYTDEPYVFGDVGPAESAWRRSSEYPFALQKTAALTNPASFYVLQFDTENIVRNTTLDQIVDVTTLQRIKPTAFKLHGTVETDGTINRVNGVSQIIADYVIHKNVNLDNVQTALQGLNLQLIYRVGGYTDKKFLKVLAEQVSPTSTNKGVFIPDTDFEIEVTKSAPINATSLSGVTVVKTTNGWTVSGYDIEKPYFDVIPSAITDNNYIINAGSVTGVVYQDFNNSVVRVPYNTEFTNKQQMTDFFVSYQRYLTLQGFVFDETLSDADGSIPKDWILSAKEFLFWQSQGWKIGSSLTLNPVSDKIKFERFGTVPDSLSQDTLNYKVLNQNFQPIRHNKLEVKRIDNAFTVQAHESAGPIYLIEISPVAYEHTIVFNNTTVFNDVLYQPELGSRQHRLKLIGHKTALWDGAYQAPGYIYNTPVTNTWQAGKDYKKGDFVIFRKKKYVAIKDQDAIQIFDQTYWKIADNIKTGLLPNLANKITAFESFYDMDSVNLESETDKFGKGLIGYQHRAYLENLELDDVSQVKFYQGMITQKGSGNAIDKLVRAQLDNMDSQVNYFEEWGFRVGEYGAIDANQVIEVELDEREFKANPELIEFLNNGDPRPQHISYIEDDLYQTPTEYTKNLFSPRSGGSNTKLDITYAGFPRLDDVDATIFDINNISDLNVNIQYVGSGYTIWTAKNLANVWDAYRVTETFVQVDAIQDVLDNQVQVHTDKSHGLEADTFIVIRGIQDDATVNGFYKVKSIVSNVEFIVDLAQEKLELLEQAGMMFKLESIKYAQPSSIATFVPKLGWQDGEITWLENNQDGNWEVLQKGSPWVSGSTVDYASVTTSDNFGSNFASSERNLWGVAGIPNSGTGLINTYVKTLSNDFIENSTYDPNDITSINGVGNSVTAGNSNYFAVGASTSNSSKGYVLVYQRDSGSAFSIHQVLSPSTLTANALFGYDVTMSEDENWLYVSATGENKIYVYALETVSSADETSATFVGDGSSSTMALFWFPTTTETVQLIDDNGKIYVPDIDFTVSGSTVTFTVAPINLVSVVARRKTMFRNIDSIEQTDDQTAGDNFGATIDTNEDGRILVVGAPQQDYVAANSTVVTDGGATYVFERINETFYADGTTFAYTTSNTIGNIYKVYVDGTLQTYTPSTDDGTGDSSIGFYNTTGNTITFKYIPSNDLIINVETNAFIQVQKLNNPTPADTDNFGNSVSIDFDANWLAVGAPGEDEVNANTGSAFIYIDPARRYGEHTGSVTSPTVTLNDKIRINDVVVEFTTGTTLDDVVTDINARNIVGITASNANETLNIVSDSDITKRKLTVMPCTGTAYTDLGLEIYQEAQQINHPSDYENENFGKQVAIDHTGNFLVVGSDRASTLKPVKFDVDADGIETTYFDQNATKWYDRTSQSGAAYVYDLLPSANEDVSNPAQYAHTQQLVSSDTETFDEFGGSVYIREGKIVVGAPKYDKSTSVTNTGLMYEFNNSNLTAGWTPYRTEDTKIEVALINKAFIYNKRKNEIVEYLDWIDPFKGKISGFAQDELTYIIERDPANYNVNTNTYNTYTVKSPWGGREVGQLWWDVSTVRYVEYEQGDLDYRAQQWGAKFPGSSIDVYEWVSSFTLPSAYTGDGTPKHPDDSSYVENQHYNSVTDTITIEYYYWVKNKETVPNLGFRKRSSSDVATLIDNPKSQGLFYLGIIDSNAIVAYNISNLLEDKNILLHVNYDVIKNDNVLHSEYQLVSEGDPQSIINDKIYTKFVDSLAGSNANGDAVPQRDLSTAERYGVLYRPRQTMFVNRETAVELFVTFCNAVFAKHQIANQFSLTTLQSAEAEPGVQSGGWDEKVLTYAELTYRIPEIFATGYNVLVQDDETHENLWTIWSKQADNTWSLVRVQAYDTNNYWNTTTWYDTGFTVNTVVNYAVQTEPDLETIKSTLVTGDLVRIKSNDQGASSIVELQSDGSWLERVVDNATIELKASLYDSSIEATGFDVAGFDNSRFDKQPVTETRKIIEAVKNDIFIEDIRIEWNNLWFTMVEYLLTEQPYADWLFKSSFIKVIQKLRGLDQYPNFQRDNQDYIKDYINEVKPYRTNVREYVLQYTKDDPWEADVTDFDVHSYYDAALGYYRKPSGELSSDVQLWDQGLNIPFGQEYKFTIGSVIVINAGTGYTEDPILTVSGGGGTGATITARTNGNAIVSVTITNAGSGYTTTPSITVDGNGIGLDLYAQLTNGQIREFDQTIKFDRYTYSSDVLTWSANTSYTLDDIISYNGEAYQAISSFTSGLTFDAANLSVYADELFLNAADRIAAYYTPTQGMVGNDLAQLQSGTDYPGVKIYGADFSANPGWDVGTFDVEPFDSFEIDADGIVVISGASALDAIIRSQYTDALLGTAAEDINIDGGAYFDLYNSHAPEELVPGITFDTLDMQVYTINNQDREYDGNGFRVYSHYYLGDGSTASFSYSDSTALQDVDNIYVWTQDNGVQYEGTDFTVNYVTMLVTFGTPPSATDKVYIYTFGNTGERPVSEDSFTATGASATYTINMDPTQVQQAYVLVDGVVSTNPIIAANGVAKVDITLTATPTAGAHVHIMLYNLATSRTAYTALEEEVFVSDGSTRVLTLANTVKYALPLAANMIVEVNSVRLRPDNVVYYQGDGATISFQVPSSAQETQGLINNADIKVAVINDYDEGSLTPITNKTVGIDYTITPYDGSSIRTITLIGDDSTIFIPGVNDTVIVGITTDAEYTMNSAGTTLTLDAGVSLSPGDKIRVLTFTNHDPARIETNVFKGTGDATPGQRFTLDRAVTNTDYLWVTVDGAKLHSAEDYSVQGSTVLIGDNTVLTASSIVVVTSFSENIMQPATGFRIFKDMLNNFEYYRIASDNITTLAQDLNIADTTVYVVDASILPTPNKNAGNPGVIMIDGERITYWDKDETLNTLTGLRRSTAGTGANATHVSGTRVQDLTGQTIPGSTHTNTWYSLGAGTATDGLGLQNSDTVPAKYLVEKKTLLPN